MMAPDFWNLKWLAIHFATLCQNLEWFSTLNNFVWVIILQIVSTNFLLPHFAYALSSSTPTPLPLKSIIIATTTTTTITSYKGIPLVLKECMFYLPYLDQYLNNAIYHVAKMFRCIDSLKLNTKGCHTCRRKLPSRPRKTYMIWYDMKTFFYFEKVAIG